MRNLIFGTIGVLWGGFILINNFLDSSPSAQGVYAAGSTVGIILGGLLFAAGSYFAVKGIRQLHAKEKHGARSIKGGVDS